MQRISLKLNQLSVGEVIILGKKIVAAMTLNAARFPEPPVPLDGLKSDIEDLLKLEQQLPGGGRNITVQRNQKLSAVKDCLDLLSFYVQIVSRGDAVIVNEAGMELAARGPRKYDTILAPEGLKIDYTGNNNELKLRWTKVKNAVQYSVELCIGAVAPDKWENGHYANGSSIIFRDLPSGELASFRVMSLGAAGKSSWSEVVSKRVP